MATQQQTQAPSDSLAPVDEKAQISESLKTTNEVQQATARDTAKQEVSPPSVFVNSEPIREDQIQNAIKFLSHPRVRGSPVIHRRSFLERKGLTKEEIDEAFRRVPDPPPSSQTTGSSQDGQQAVSNIQPQGQIQTLQPVATAPAPIVMTPPPGILSRFHWYHAVLAIGVLAASGAGTAIFVKKSLIPRFKSWVRRIVLEEETDPMMKADGKPSLAEEAVAAAKAASAAASDVARVSQEMMITKNEERKYFEDLMNRLDVQVQEMKSLSNTVRKLEGQSDNRQRVYSADQEVFGGSVTTARRPPYTNGSNVDYDSRSARSASPPMPQADASVPPHPKSYMDIMSMIQRGEKPSNIREINDMPPNPNQQPTNPRIAPKSKPWDNGQAQDENSNGQWWQRKNPRLGDLDYQTTTGRFLGNQSETNITEPPVAIQQQRPTWVPPQPPPVVMAEAAEAIRRPKPLAKIDQQVASDDQSSNSLDELQQITKFSESGGDGSGRLQITEIQEEQEQQQQIIQEDNSN